MSVQWLALPDEVLLAILRWLGPCSLLNAARVCKHWRALARDDACWRVHWVRAQLIPSVCGVLQLPEVAGIALWKSYHWLFLVRPLTQMEALLRAGLKILSLFAFPADSHRVRIHPMEPDVVSKWSFKVIAPGMAQMVVHLHKNSDVLCLRWVQCKQGYRIRPGAKDVQCADWNRFYTLTRGSDVDTQSEWRPWLTVERI